MKPLKLAFVSTGDFSHIRPYLSFFRDRGHEVHWLAYTKPFEVEGITIHDISRGASSKGSQWAKWRYLLSVPRLRTLLQKLQPDIVHGHYSTSAGLLCLLSGCRPYVLSVRGTDLIGSVRSRLWRFLLAKAFGRAALVHAVSDQLAGLVLDLGVPAGRCLVATQGVDLDSLKFRPPCTLGKQVNLICTRSLYDVYDPFVIVQACALLQARGVDFKLAFAGTGPLAGALRDRINSSGLQDRVVLLGGYSHDQVGEVLRGSDIYVSASRWDGTSISLLEAMACGVFPVITRIPSNQAWLEEDKNGLMFAPGDAGELADAVVRAVADSKLRASAVNRNRQVVEQRANRAQNMLSLEQRYYSIARDAGSVGLQPRRDVKSRPGSRNQPVGTSVNHWDQE